MVDPINRKLGKLLGEAMDGRPCRTGEGVGDAVAPSADDVSYEAAAALPVAYGTAYRMMVARGKIAAGEKVPDPRGLGRRRHVLRPARQARRRASSSSPRRARTSSRA